MSGIVRQDKLYIGGEWVDPIDGDVVPTIDPSTGEPWAEVAFGGPKDIDRAVAAAKEAFEGPWRRMPVTERAALLRRFAEIYARRADELVQLEARDSGRAIREVRADARAREEEAEHPLEVAVIRLLLYTGARISEIRDLRWEWVRPPHLALPDSKTGAKLIWLNSQSLAIFDAVPRNPTGKIEKPRLREKYFGGSLIEAQTEN